VKKISHSKHESLNELNITPLLDLAFVLLVIFIITTPQLVNNLEMNLPSGKPPASNGPKPKLNYIMVKESGEISLNDQPMTLPVLRQNLLQMHASDPETGVVVKSSGNVDYQNIIYVLDALQQADITKVGLATEAVGG
jgi:biopolymer transport protein ExbD